MVSTKDCQCPGPPANPQCRCGCPGCVFGDKCAIPTLRGMSRCKHC